MPRTEKQFEEIRENKKNLIMLTALDMFANEGYHTTSISKIALKAGISKGLLYNYFDSKEALITAIIGQGIDQLMESFDPNRDGFLSEEELEYMVNESFRILKDNTDYWKLYFSTMMQPAVHRIVMVKYAALVPRMMAMVEDYFRRKGVEDPALEAQYFSALLDGVSMNYVMNPDGFPLDKIKTMIIQRYK